MNVKNNKDKQNSDNLMTKKQDQGPKKNSYNKCKSNFRNNRLISQNLNIHN